MHGQDHIHECNHADSFHHGLDNHFHGRNSLESLPIAVCVIAGTRFDGRPIGISPINADGCAPTGLK